MIVPIEFSAWPTVEPTDWSPATRGGHVDDQVDFHVDLGCGRVKKGRIGVDRYAAPGVNVVMDLSSLFVYAMPLQPGADAFSEREIAPGSPLPMPISSGLPFPDGSIESIVTHHCLEHVGDGFVKLIDECWRVLKPDGLLRAIVPLFPSRSAVEDPDHKRYFMEDTFASFLGSRSGECWLDSFSVPYTRGRFLETAKDCTPLFPPDERWTTADRREMRISLRAVK